MTVHTDSSVAERRVGRYVLEDLVADRAGTSLWRAMDPLLQRPVGARLMPLNDPRVEKLRAAALAAAGVDDRRLVGVLDVVETDEHLAVITEWVIGRSWSELLAEGASVQEALVVAMEVGEALETAHAAGVTHGRIRPDSVMISDTSEVRIRGLGVEAAIWGVDPEGDPNVADLHGLGALLYAGTTLRWPAVSGRGSVDGLRLEVPIDGRLPAPSDLVADVPPIVDEICGKSMSSVGRSADDNLGYSEISECVRALDSAAGSLPSPEAQDEYVTQTEIRTDRIVGRLSTAAIFLFALAGIGLLVWQLVANVVSGPDSGPAPSDGNSTAISRIPPFETMLPEAAFTIASAEDFDPGGDDEENPHLTSKAIDGSKKTAWVTADYPNANMNPKDGVGLLLDLGTIRPFSALNLLLYGRGTDFQILTSKRKTEKVSDFRKVVEINAAGNAIKVRTPNRVKARYVLIWFTGLPYDGANYVGGIRDVKIVG